MLASEARALANEINEPSKIKMVTMFDQRIKEAASKGYYATSIQHVEAEDLAGAVKAQGLLVALGFKVDSFVERGPAMKWTFLVQW